MLCVVLCGVCRCGRGVVGGRGGRGVCLVCVCVCLVSVCVCVFVCVLRHAEKRGKTVFGFKKRLRVYVQNLPDCTGTTRTCVETCARGAGTHGDVLNVHTEFRSVSHINTHTLTHTTQQNTTQHNTTHYDHNTTRRKRQRQTETEKEDRDRERREDGRGEKRQEKRRQKKTRQDKRREKIHF